MIRIGISAALEKSLRGAKEHQDPRQLYDGVCMVLEAIDADRARERDRKGISYYTIVTTLQGVLGSRLVLPPSPSKNWIAKITHRVQELGYDVATLERLGRATAPGKVELEWLVWRGGRLLDSGLEADRGGNKVVTGRADEEDSETGNP